MGYDVICIGSATVDHFADTDSELIRIETRTSKQSLIAYPLGSKILINELCITTGGGGTNSAVTFARLGFRTGFLGKVGPDENGDFILHKLRDEGIDFIGARGGLTGFSMVLNSIAEDRSILAFKGANNELDYHEVGPIDSPWLYMSSMLGQSFETLVRIASESSAKLVFNPSNYQAKLGYAGLARLIDRLEVLVMNREETCKFLGLRTEEQHSIDSLFLALAKLPPRIFVITNGDEGAYVYDRQQRYHAWPTPDLQVIGSTGAGDAFASTFTGGLMLGQPIRVALEMAMTNAESVLTHKGCKENLLSLAALQERLPRLSRRIDCRPLACDPSLSSR